jgi:transcriptional regulator with XRE-family HTH domain
MTTIERIKKLAKKYDMNLQETAEKAGIGINTIYKWKNYDPKDPKYRVLEIFKSSKTLF